MDIILAFSLAGSFSPFLIHPSFCRLFSSACAAFFRRSVVEKKIYRCRQAGQCPIKKGKKKNHLKKNQYYFIFRDAQYVPCLSL
jgi:hypothetical protein